MIRMLSHNFTFVGSFPSQKYTDLKLTTPEEVKGRGREVLAHKVVLAAASKKMERIIDERGGGG